MSALQQYFERNGYALLPMVLTPEKCRGYLDRLFRLDDAGQLAADKQCPRSKSIYGDAALDELLDQLSKPLSATLGRTLLPTYSYARIYMHGETLKRHVDRPACEISATMTLGYDGDRVWPISFAKDRFDFLGKAVEIPIGSMVAYKGCELPHWRERFEGQWQAQVFLHYVDAAGPFAAEHRDRRAES